MNITRDIIDGRHQPPVSNWFAMNETGVAGDFTEHPYFNIPDMSGNLQCFMPVVRNGAVLGREAGNLNTWSASALEPFVAQACPCSNRNAEMNGMFRFRDT